MTGISLGVMTPDPETVLYETYCPGCHKAVRGTGLSHVGAEDHIRCQCGECGVAFETTAKARELDS